jgi:epoxyqueuosine reductase QueG
MKNKKLPENKERIKRKIIEMGANLVGIADVNDLRDLKVYPTDLLKPFARAISIAVQLPIAIFDTISDRPTSLYNHFYKISNSILDEIALRISVVLQNEGFSSLPIPTSDYVDKENFYGSISHKAVARMAGLGWQGKNLLIITPQFGSRVRLVTVLTTALLLPDVPIKNRCGDCMLCRDACPAEAIKGVNTEDHYKNRNEALHFSKCVEKLAEFMEIPGISGRLCGICIRVCPFGRKGKGNKDEIEQRH